MYFLKGVISMARYFDIVLRNEIGDFVSYWADSFSVDKNGVLSVYSRDCGNIKARIMPNEKLSVETVDVKEEWEEMMEFYESLKGAD